MGLPARLFLPQGGRVPHTQWTLDYCVKFIECMAKSHKGSMSVENNDLVVGNFRSNRISGSRLGDSEWKDLIPFIGFCNHIKAGIEKIREDNKKEGISQLTASSKGSSKTENRKYRTNSRAQLDVLKQKFGMRK
jgi:hypothetical protein